MDDYDEISNYLRHQGVVAWGRTLVGIGCLVGLAGNIAILYSLFQFLGAAWHLPRGTSIRPMGLTFFFFQVGFGTILLGLPFSTLGTSICKKATDRQGAKWGGIGTFLQLLPSPLAMGLFLLIVVLLGLELSE